MSDELFHITEQPLSELAQARIAFAIAQEEYAALDLACDDLGLGEEFLGNKLRNAELRLLRAEQRALGRMKRA